jgi:hypothetical protein
MALLRKYLNFTTEMVNHRARGKGSVVKIF